MGIAFRSFTVSASCNGAAQPASSRCSLRRVWLPAAPTAALMAVLMAALIAGPAAAQSPTPLPYTMSTLAGTSPMAATSGTQCPNLPTGVKSTDAYGDGCLAVNGIFGASARGGVAVDAFGNVFIQDDIKGVLHVVNPDSGIMTVLAGGNTACTGKQDAAGDGCTAATGTALSGQRGIGLDYWGNVLSAGYSDNLVHIICRVASPNCTTAQIGTMQAIAGCSNGTGSNGSGGQGLSNTPAKTLSAGSCTTSLGEVGAPRGVWGDAYGNIYYADTNNSRFRVVLGPQTSSYFSGSNPLYTVLLTNSFYASLTAGYVYSVINVTPDCATATYTNTTNAYCGGNPTVAGKSCSNGTGSTAPLALDTLGDGCPFQYSSVYSSSGFTSAIATDAAGNVLFTDPDNGLRVLFVSGSGTAGQRMSNAIAANNPTITPTVGYVYMLAGAPLGTTGTNSLSTTPHLGTSVGALDSVITKLAVGPQGDVFIGDSSRVLFFDINTGYIRVLFAGSANKTAGSYCTGSAGQKSLSAYSDGCAATQSIFSNSSGLGLAADQQDNLYLFDAGSNTSAMLVRKVLAQDLVAGAVGTALIQNVNLHFPESAAGTVGTPTVASTSNADISLGSISCAAQNADNSVDCNVPVTATPSAPGLRSATLTATVPITINSVVSSQSEEVSLQQTATGSALAFDSATSNGTAIPATTTTPASGISPAGVAVDGAGNVYTMDTIGGQFLESIAGTSTAISGTLPITPSQLALDPLGDIFAVGSGTASITELAITGAPSSANVPATYTATSVTYTPIAGTATPQAIAVDQAGNLFVADKQSTTANTAIYRVSLAAGNGAPQYTVGTGYNNPVSLAVDLSGNVYVADKGAAAVYKLAPLATGLYGYTQTTVALPGGTLPVSVATDAAGDLYVQDSNTNTVIEVPLTGATTTVLTGLSAPSGLAVDNAGNVYSGDSTLHTITKVIRNATAFSFGTGSTGSPTYAGTLTDVGNQSVTGQATGTGINTTNFNVVAGAANGCTFASSVLGAQASGNACTLSATFIGSGSGLVTDTITYLPTPTLGSLAMSGTLTGTAIGTTTSISGQTPSSPNYAPSATEVSFTVTVAPASGTNAPGGTVNVTVTNTATGVATTTGYSLTASGSNGVVTVNLSGLVAGSYTISAAYPISGSFSASSSGSTSFSIAQNTTVTTWSPGASSVNYSAPVGTAVLNAAATYNSAAVPGVFVYTANGAEINAATYLAIGSYTLGVTFYPTDATDYTSSTASGGTFTVTKATTTAPIGATQNLVAADGTGNFTTVQSALNSLPATGGKIYIKPGTYTGFVTVITPNTSIYGLGGNPGNVILTNEDGAFSPTYLPGQGPGNNGHTNDEGSATMVIARDAISGYNGGATTTPYNFYGENFSIINTYDTDSTNQQYNQYINNACTTVMTPLSNFTLFNGAGTTASPGLCNSQALAIWMTGDQLVLNNVYAASLQDTIFAGAISSSSAYAARQYWFRGKVTGNVDYIFGDSALVFDHTSIYSVFHGTSANGEDTIEAQDKAAQTGSAGDYLSGYIMNSDVFTSQAPNMTSLYFGRPYGPGNQNSYSTWVMLNSYIDQVAAAGYVEFTPGTTHSLPLSTYVEYNNHPYTDPAPNANDLNGVPYSGSGGNTGSGVTGTRETQSTNPGTIEVASNGFQTNYPALANTTLSQIEAQQYYPIAFLGTTVASNPYNNGVTNWNPTTAIAAGANGFVPGSSPSSITAGQSITLLMRPQTPGQGAVSNGVYTIPTGTYTLYDNGTQIANGSLDASGEATYISSSLTSGCHNFTWTYGGDTNFAGSTTATAYALAVGGTCTTTTTALVSNNSPTYGQAASITATVTPSTGTATGTVTLTIDGTSTLTGTLSNGAYTFSVTGLRAGAHSFSASYAGGASDVASATTSNLGLTVGTATLTVTASCSNRIFGAPNVCSATPGSYQYSDSAATVFTGTPAATTTALRNSPANTYPATLVSASLALTTFGAANYTLSTSNGSFTISGGAPQSILFAALPNFTHGGSYQLTASTTSGLPVTYTVTAGNSIASVSGSTLTVTGTGPVTVQATQAIDPTGDYAPATAVSRSFTAQ